MLLLSVPGWFVVAFCVLCAVQYPGVADSISSDVDNLMRLVRTTSMLPKGLYVENAVEVAKKELALECD